MKNRIFFAAIVIIALAFGFALSGCGDVEERGRERVTITFNYNYPLIDPDDPDEGYVPGQPNDVEVTIYKGATIGTARWPSNPTLIGYSFRNWRDGRTSGTTYTRGRANSIEFDQDKTLYAQWEKTAELRSELAPQPAPEVIEALFVPGATKNPTAESGEFPSELSDSRKIWGMGNPIITFAYLADPVPMVFCHANPPCIRDSGDTENQWCDECTLYMYGSNDTLAFENGVPPSDNFGLVIQGLRAVSSKDLVNWTDHGPINLIRKTSTHPMFPTPSERIVNYATGNPNDTWAPSAEWKMVEGQLKVFLYWCNGGNNTSVVVSDNGPLGPWYNPGLNIAMIHKDMPNANVSWLFDPGTLIDYDGSGYIVLGGDGSGEYPGNSRRAPLSESMTSISQNVERYDPPYMFEASDIWKWNGIYYLNYTTNWGSGGGFSNIDVAYMMNTAGPMAEFPRNSAARLLPNGSYGDNTNHASLFDFKGEPYLVYHTCSACLAYDVPRLRVAHLLKIGVRGDGTLYQINYDGTEKTQNNGRPAMGVEGVPAVPYSNGKFFNPYERVEAETMAIGGGIYTKYDETASNSITVASIDTGDWLGLYDVDFSHKSGGATKFFAMVKLPVTEGEEVYTGAIEIRINPERMMEGASTTASDASVLRVSGGSGALRTRIKADSGDVIGRVQLQASKKEDEGEWKLVVADLLRPVTTKEDLVFVFYSSTGAYPERHDARPTVANDGRQRNVGFEIDQWWFD